MTLQIKVQVHCTVICWAAFIFFFTFFYTHSSLQKILCVFISLITNVAQFQIALYQFLLLLIDKLHFSPYSYELLFKTMNMEVLQLLLKESMAIGNVWIGFKCILTLCSKIILQMSCLNKQMVLPARKVRDDYFNLLLIKMISLAILQR